MNGYASLPDTLYPVIVPIIATMSEFEMEFVGMINPVTNGEESAAETLKMTRVRITIDRMIDIYSNGFTIKLVNKYDAPVIYHTLENYILGYNPYNQSVTLNKAIEMDTRVDTIKKFMIAIMENNTNTIVRYDIGTARNGFDLGFGTIKHEEPKPLVEPGKNVMNKRTFGVRNVDNSGVVYNQTPVIDFDMVKYKKGMKNVPVFGKD